MTTLQKNSATKIEVMQAVRVALSGTNRGMRMTKRKLI